MKSMGQIKPGPGAWICQKSQHEPDDRIRDAQSTWRKAKILLAFQENEKNMMQGHGDNRR